MRLSRLVLALHSMVAIRTFDIDQAPSFGAQGDSMTRVLILGMGLGINKALLRSVAAEIQENCPGLSIQQVEEQTLKSMGLMSSCYYRDSIKDRHSNDDWRGRGNRRKVFK
ncbi:hypothetical protein F965_00076 [Acinetobacter schindleri NIPH 900]|uniref:Uncharacterized protein n=1 Tax=Acinetobacter schindleri NIPH 900 TaxID=1217675 RepID=N8Y5X6_9GAMM|nr:hypothetical protein [Acinetobacter schindleri]ENV14730.1 hypothetical protein F965_00076 [Acinetobacter schindleri NIPH 900]